MNQILAPEIAEQLGQDAELGARLDGLSYTEQRPLIRAAIAQRFPDVELLTAKTNVEEHEIAVPDGTLRLHVYTPLASRTRGAFFHIHGGGFTLGSIDDLFTVAKCAHICAQVGCTVTTVDYRLAPEFPYPTAAEDCYAALCWVVEHAPTLGIDESRIVVGGESAGGNLAAAVALMARDRGRPPLAFQLLEVPVVDMSADSKAHLSLGEFGRGYGLDATAIEAFETAYLSDPRVRRDAYASPLCAPDLRGLPPAHVLTAEFDPLRDSGEAYARRLYEAGVPTTIHRFLGHTHGSAGLWRTWAPAAEWMAEIVTTLERATSAAPRSSPRR
jgi:acetyl esterase